MNAPLCRLPGLAEMENESRLDMESGRQAADALALVWTSSLAQDVRVEATDSTRLHDLSPPLVDLYKCTELPASTPCTYSHTHPKRKNA